MQPVLITGTSRGPGRALALGFSAAGCTVSACATDPDAIQSLPTELGQEHLPLPWGRSTSSGSRSLLRHQGGIEGLTAALAAELPKGLAAVALNPGIIDTRMLRSSFGDAADGYDSRHPAFG